MKKLLLLFIIVVAFNSCTSDDDALNPRDGSLDSVANFLSEDLLNTLQNLGFEINTGRTPPNIEGEFLISDFELFASDVEADVIGTIFSDYTTIFSNQDNTELTVDYSGAGGPQTDDSLESYLIGDGQQFTFLSKLTSQISGVPVESGIAISGTIGNEGIIDIKAAFLMIDDNGDPYDIYDVENNQGRVFIDSDGFSPRQ